MSTQKSFSFWWTWLVGVNALVMLFGLSMVLVPDLIQQFFSLALYGTPLKLATFGEPAVSYLTLLHGVLGAAMFGWGVALTSILFDSFRQVKLAGWWGLALSILAWFIPDSLFSLWTGFWQNAILNLGFVLLYTFPLAATYRDFRHGLPGHDRSGKHSDRP
jgi:hypothetical protein